MKDDDFLTAKEAAAYLQTTENSLRSMRSVGQGPRFHRLDGFHVRYLRSDLDAYHAACGPSRRRSRMDRMLADEERAAPGSTPARP